MLRGMECYTIGRSNQSSGGWLLLASITGTVLWIVIQLAVDEFNFLIGENLKSGLLIPNPGRERKSAAGV